MTFCTVEKCQHYSQAIKYPRKCYYEPQCWKGYFNLIIDLVIGEFLDSRIKIRLASWFKSTTQLTSRGVTTARRMIRIILWPMSLMLLLAGIIIGYGIHEATTEPIIRAQIIKEYVPSPPEIIYERVEVPVEIIKEVEIVIETVQWRNIYGREFDGVENFKEWYYAQNFTPLFPSGAYNVDCDDYAQRLQITALRQGYPVSVALIKAGKYYDVDVSPIKEGHVGNLVNISGTYYYIDVDGNELNIIKVVDRD